MKKRPNVCDSRICIRLPRTLVNIINTECDKHDTNLSVFVRQSLVETLSQIELDKACEVSR
jgi:hypothetical protein